MSAAARDPLETGAWFVGTVPRTHARQRLYCLPYAGGAASVYRGWAELLPEDVELWPIEPPGRWYQANVRPCSTTDQLVRLLGPVIAAQPGPYSLFGYSWGGTVAFELARWMRAAHQPLPQQLIVASTPAPSVQPGGSAIHALADAELIAEVAKRYAPLPAVLLADPDLRPLVLRALRADLACVELYPYQREPPLDVPITVLAGTADAHLSRASAEAWAGESSFPIELELFDGGHFFLNERREQLVSAVGRALARGSNADGQG